LARIGIICFTLIPFYYHSVVYSYPSYIQKGTSCTKIVSNYFFRKDVSKFLSFCKGVFNILGFFLFVFYTLRKIGAVLHNWFHLIVVQGNAQSESSPHSFLTTLAYDYSKMDFDEQYFLQKRLITILLIFAVALYFIRVFWKARTARNWERGSNRLHPIFVTLFLMLYLSKVLFLKLAIPLQQQSVNISVGQDPDIVLFNIENNDRMAIAKIIKSIDSCNPAAIGVNVIFSNKVDDQSDKELQDALASTNNDVLVYNFSKTGDIDGSDEIFVKLSSGYGYFENLENINELITHFIPAKKAKSGFGECFALQILKVWQPSYNIEVPTNKKILINYTKTNTQFITIDSNALEKQEIRLFLKGKVVIVGYLGPDKEDCYYTPLQQWNDKNNEGPDTYGSVIIANELRTLMQYDSRQNKPR